MAATQAASALGLCKPHRARCLHSNLWQGLHNHIEWKTFIFLSTLGTDEDMEGWLEDKDFEHSLLGPESWKVSGEGISQRQSCRQTLISSLKSFLSPKNPCPNVGVSNPGSCSTEACWIYLESCNQNITKIKTSKSEIN